MARDKLITIRIEGEKRQAFGDLAKSQNTDTASLLYDFISQCLDGGIDISLVTGKGNRLDNRIDSNRLDKLETDTQRIVERVGQNSKKLNDWIEAFGDRLSDCDRELTEKITSLEHRLKTLSIQLDIQKDRQRETPDMEPLIKEALRLDHLDDQKLIDAIESQIEDTEIDESDYESVTSPLPPVATVETVTDTVETVEAVDKVETMEPDSIDESVTGSIGPVPGDSIEPGKGEGMNAVDADKYLKDKKVKVSDDSLYRWIRQEKIPDSPQGKKVQKYLTLRDGLYYPIN
jgi:hypothetical protein